MAQCKSIISNGTQCLNSAVEGKLFCSYHVQIINNFRIKIGAIFASFVILVAVLANSATILKYFNISLIRPTPTVKPTVDPNLIAERITECMTVHDMKNENYDVSSQMYTRDSEEIPTQHL